MKIIKTDEYDIDAQLERSILGLLIESFPDLYPQDRIYYKQLPHFRYLVYDEKVLVAHVALDYRIMNLNGSTIKVLGIIDLCVKREYRSKKLASELLNEVDAFSRMHNIDFLLLFADIDGLYHKNGFIGVKNICKWLRIDEHKTLGVGEEVVKELMIKKTGSKD
ncbi:MAG: family N-acetyltransferase [Clostridia bacterium]|nr:family N-acetyltransferase [Clostridia bacterium]